MSNTALAKASSRVHAVQDESMSGVLHATRSSGANSQIE